MKTRLTILSLIVLFYGKAYSQIEIYDENNSLYSGADILVDQGVKLYKTGDYKGAIEDYKKALDMNPQCTRAEYEMANTYFTMRNYPDAIEYAGKVIAAKDRYVKEAYVLKGSAMDRKGDSKEAIKIYDKGLLDYPESYLLHYNLALIYNEIKKNKEAEEELIRALTINPSYAEGHLLLAFITNEEGKIINTMLALYSFLILEPTGTRAESALKQLNDLMKKIISQNGSTTTAPLYENDEFAPAGLMLHTLYATKYMEGDKDKTGAQQFYENTTSLFNVLADIEKANKSFWWSFYVDYYKEMSKSNNTETMCYYISQSSGNAEVNNWLKNNDDKVRAFLRWDKDYKRVK